MTNGERVHRAPRKTTPGRSTLPAAGLTLGLVGLVGLAGCTTNRQVEFGPSTARPTVTVTVTVTATPTTSTGSGTTTPAAPTTLPGPTPTTGTTTGPFNRTIADQTYASIVTDIGVLDGQFASSASPALRLDVLARQFATLFTLGVPPGLDGPSYLARVRTLDMFAAAAAQEAMTDLPRAAERYQVVRRETALLLLQVNGALGTTFALPTSTPSPTSSLTAPPR